MQPEVDKSKSSEEPVAADKPDPDLDAKLAAMPELTMPAEPASSPLKKKPGWRFWTLITIIVILVLGGGSWAGWKLLHHRAAAPAKKPVAAIVKPKDITKTSFLTMPLRLHNLHFFQDLSYFGTDCPNVSQAQLNSGDTSGCHNSVSDDDIAYYQLGTLSGGKPIIGVVDTIGGDGSFTYTALQTTDNHYAILGLLSADKAYWTNPSNTDKDALQKALSPNVTLDTTTTIPELNFPLTLSVGQLKTNVTTYSAPDWPQGYIIPNGLASLTDPQSNKTPPAVKKIGNSGNKTVYEVTVNSQPNYELKELYATVTNVYAAHYTLADSLIPSDSSASPPHIIWNDGSHATDTYTSRPQGCGSATGYVVARNVGGTLLQIGTGPDGQALYQLPSDNALFQEIYHEDYDDGAGTADSSLQDLTADQFQARHGVFVARNALGEYVVYMNKSLVITDGCGKPVIYLYPPTATSVRVQVGAQITKSDPIYTTGGWQHVLAQPNGQLTYQGKHYSSLFWEGLGLGAYPAITSGTVVPRAQVASTIRRQLAEQGLTSAEIADFMDFWGSKLPTTPYARLTWFNTRQMNKLAPLTITPAPMTTIRVFLDFQGLEQPVSLPAQHLNAPLRKGFTVVEWGGLLQTPPSGLNPEYPNRR